MADNPAVDPSALTQALIDTSRLIAMETEQGSTDVILIGLAEQVRALLHAADASVYLAEHWPPGTLRPHFRSPPDEQPEELAPEVAQAVLASERAIVVPTNGPPPARGARTDTLIVPLWAGGAVEGALVVRWARPVDLDDLTVRTVEALAVQAGLVRHNARLLEEATRRARLDGAVKTARTVADQLNNRLGLMLGYGELLTEQVEGEPHQLASSIVEGAAAAAATVNRLQQIVRFAEVPTPIGPALDLDSALVDRRQRHRDEAWRPGYDSIPA